MKKGFTLIELLAVIVILAIIALIAYPTITSIVEKTKKGGAEQSANGFINAVENQKAINLMDSNDENDLNDGVYDANMDSYNVKVKGQKPSSGWVEVTKNGVNRYSLVIGGYVVTYDGTNKTVVKGTEAADRPGPKSFATDSWATIIDAVRNNNTSAYHVGDTKEVDMGELDKHIVRIANMSSPSECSTDGFSQTACGFVLEFEDTIAYTSMNSESTNVGGWPATSFRARLNSDIYNSLPSDLKPGIINTLVISGHGFTQGETNFVSTDKLYLLSTKELWGKEGTSDIISNDTAEAETRQLDYYKNIGVTTSNRSGATKYHQWYWLRTAVSDGTDKFYSVGRFGDIGTDIAQIQNTYSPAFRIG